MPTMHSHFLVKNLHGTSKNKCPCRTWIGHWERVTGNRGTRNRCAVLNCQNEAEVGAHVQLQDWRHSREWWIAPICRTHNHFRYTEAMWLERGVALASANVSMTCG